jgi:hypothetical protein
MTIRDFSRITIISFALVLIAGAISADNQAQEAVNLQEARADSVHSVIYEKALEEAAKSYKYDSSDVSPARISDERMERFKNDPDLNYSDYVASQMSFTEKVRFWINELIDEFFSELLGFATESTWKTILWLAFFIALVIALIYWLDIKFGRLLSANPSINSNNSGFLDDMDKINPETILAMAEENSNFREATRMNYLILLKKLNAAKYIRLEKNKTNIEFYNEMRKAGYGTEFREIASAFDYVWYGDFKLKKDDYYELKESFTNFFEKKGQKGAVKV